MGKFKVLHIFSSTSTGGAEKMTVSIAKNLNKFSNDFESVVAAPKKSYIYEQALAENLRIYDFSCRGSFTPTGLFKLFNIIRKEKVNIVHVHQGKLYWTALVMKIFFKNLKVALHRHQDTRHKWYAKWHYKLADITFAVSNAVKENLVKCENAPENKISVLYNGFDFENFAKDIDCKDLIEKYNLKDKIIIGTVGAMVSLEGKGQKYLLEAISQLRKSYNNIVCLLIGDGIGRKEQELYAKELKIDDLAIFTGYQENVAKYINVMNIFCLPSCDTEGFGNVNIEAQYLAKPVITTNIGGVPETVIKDKTAIMVSPKNAKELANAISKLIENKDYALKLGIEGKKFVEQTFSANVMINNLVNSYKTLLNNA